MLVVRRYGFYGNDIHKELDGRHSGFKNVRNVDFSFFTVTFIERFSRHSERFIQYGGEGVSSITTGV